MSKPELKPEVILSSDGSPFKSEQGGHARMRAMGVQKDKYEVVKVKGGWAVLPHGASLPEHLSPVQDALLESDESCDDGEASAQPEEKCFRVRFYPRTNPNDTEDVSLGVNGEILNIQREQVVVLPGRYLEAARNARLEKFRQIPGESRKSAGWVMSYPFEVLGEAPWSEFRNMYSEGSRISRENLLKYGPDGPGPGA